MKDLECQWNVRRSHQHQPAAMGGRVFYFFQIPSVPLLPHPTPTVYPSLLRPQKLFGVLYTRPYVLSHIMKEFYLWAATEVFTASCVKVAWQCRRSVGLKVCVALALFSAEHSSCQQATIQTCRLVNSRLFSHQSDYHE
jgi:hypothetical protein